MHLELLRSTSLTSVQRLDIPIAVCLCGLNPVTPVLWGGAFRCQLPPDNRPATRTALKWGRRERFRCPRPWRFCSCLLRLRTPLLRLPCGMFVGANVEIGVCGVPFGKLFHTRGFRGLLKKSRFEAWIRHQSKNFSRS